ncbi:hypothetical protein OIU84_014155 [Salix udensis]|uniref:Secretory carrier-associated membrane protein n=1 Tax=Salix udensis TaxID=889485 RepID=A0AAD6JBJ0_9ROSI|nr:hypothetical protein OIU84_014155 [Salix udensis]
MAGRYDPNPFDEEEVNPFFDPAGVPPASNSKLSPLPPEPAGFYNYGTTVDIPIDAAADLRKKEKEIQAREAELRRREKRREEAAARAGIVLEEKNWPPFFPIIHHDITNEIPVHLQKFQHVALTTFLGLTFCLFWNVIAVTTAWIKGEGVKIWFLAIIYFVSGVPGAYFLWYRPLYRLISCDIRYLIFVNLFFSQLHIGFCIFAAVAPPIIFKGNSLTGVLAAIDVAGNSVLAGIFYFIGFGCFCLESLLSIWVIQQVYMYFRGSGKAAEMKREAARGALRAAA